MTEIIDIVEPAIPGSKGDRGPAGEIADATAEALPTGAEPTITLGGTPSERTMHFGLPRGPKGDPGDGSVNSVNGDFGPNVVLTAGDVGSIPEIENPVDGTLIGYSEQDGYSAVNAGRKLSISSGVLSVDPSIGEYNVFDYGATGDGTTDDKNAIQAALDAAHASGGGEVIVPPGEYFVGSILIIRANTVFTAYGARFKKGSTPYSWFRNFDKANDSFPGYTGNGNILIRGGTWIGVAGSYSEASGNCITLAHCENVEVRDVTFIDVTAAAHAVEFNAVKNGKITNCTALGYQEIGGTSNRSEAFQVDIASTATVVCEPADDTICENVSITGCVVDKSDNLGHWGAGIGSHNMVAGKFHEKITVANNEIRGALQQGIHMFQWRDSTVRGNHVSNCGDIGIMLVGAQDTAGSSPSGIVIAENVLIANNTGIQVSGLGSNNKAHDCVIQGNVVSGSGSWGIRVYLAKSIAVSSNAVDRNGSHGILIAESEFNTIVGNVVSDCAGYGIILSPDANDCMVTGNMVRKPGSGAYRLSSGSSRNSVIANAARLDGRGTAAGLAFSATAAANNNRRFGNDFYGMGSSSISDSGTGSNTTTADRT